MQDLSLAWIKYKLDSDSLYSNFVMSVYILTGSWRHKHDLTAFPSSCSSEQMQAFSFHTTCFWGHSRIFWLLRWSHCEQFLDLVTGSTPLAYSVTLRSGLATQLVGCAWQYGDVSKQAETWPVAWLCPWSSALKNWHCLVQKCNTSVNNSTERGNCQNRHLLPVFHVFRLENLFGRWSREKFFALDLRDM